MNLQSSSSIATIASLRPPKTRLLDSERGSMLRRNTSAFSVMLSFIIDRESEVLDDSAGKVTLYGPEV